MLRAKTAVYMADGYSVGIEQSTRDPDGEVILGLSDGRSVRLEEVTPTSLSLEIADLGLAMECVRTE